MYFMFGLILLFIVVNNIIAVRHQLDDDHPFIAGVREKVHDKFMLIPSIGFETNDGGYLLSLNGWYYESLKPNTVQNFIKGGFHAALHLLDRDEKFSDHEKKERLEPFFVSDMANHEITLRLSESVSKTISTDENGRFHETISVDSLDGMNYKGHALKYTASDKHSNETGDEGLIYLMQNHDRCSIISDIDDTIKISEVPNKKKLAVNTFKKDFRAVPGISDLYHTWRTSHHCLFHYVSAMPSQLYYVTQKFLNKEKFPGGSFHMRHLKLVSSEKYQLISKVLDFAKRGDSQKHKLHAIEWILKHAPMNQQFVMVGDSGELDPEIYGQIARNYPDRIKMIFIRLVEGGNNDDSRFNTTFKDIPDDKWRLFAEVDQLPQKLFDDDTNKNDDDDDEFDSKNKAMILSTRISFYYCIFIFILTLFYV